MQNVKKLLAFVLIVTCTVSLMVMSGGVKERRAEKKIKVGLSMYTLGAPYFAAQAEAARKKAEN